MSDERNIDALNRLLEQEPPPPHYITLWHAVGCKGALGDRGSLKERIAERMAVWIASVLMRNVETRKMFCLAISSEMVRTLKWLDEKPPALPPSKDD